MSDAIFASEDSKYMHDYLYESYINEKIESEDALAYHLKESLIITESDYSNIVALHEANNLSVKIKNKLNKFVAFIKNMVGRFMEVMTDLLYNESKYLEKYKDIILKKAPKDPEREYEYNGHYPTAIKRIREVKVPLFDYTNYKVALDAKGEGEFVTQLMRHTTFKYKDDETLADQFKEYFLGVDAAEHDGMTTGRMKDLNMTDIYNFCHDWGAIKKITDEDQRRIENSTKAIEAEINKVAKEAPAEDSTEESALLEETGSDKKPETGASGTDKKDKDTTVKTTNFTVNAASTDARDTDKEKAQADSTINSLSDDASIDNQKKISSAASKWIEVCNALVAAKYTACQQIANDFMKKIIRPHVKSYVGNVKSSGNDRAKKAGTEYDTGKAKANPPTEDKSEDKNKK